MTTETPPADRAAALPFGTISTPFERMLQQTLDQLNTGVYFLDREWRLVFVNEIGRRLFPDPTLHGLGMSLWDINPSAQYNEFGAAIKAAADAKQATTVRAYSERLKGWFEITTYPSEEGMAIYFRDVTEEQVTKLQLDDTMRRLRRKAALLDSAKDAIYVRELDHTVSFWNNGAERLYGWSAQEMTGQSTRDLLYADKEAFDRSTRQLLATGEWQGELEQVTRDGRVIIGDCRWRLSHDVNSETSFVLCVVSDVTDQKAEQETRYRAQRMESLGTLASGLAHDLNNVFTPILVTSQLLAYDETDARRRDMLLAIETSVNRGAEMIRQVLSFARGEEINRSIVHVPELIEQVEAFCSTTIPPSVEVRTDAPTDVWPVLADATQVLQVVMNLITNARDAMPDGGTLKITARNVGDAETGAGRFVAIDVEDTGSGMDASTISKVFDPFFSTKAVGRGTGLGLSTSVAVARGHGGDLQVKSRVGIGSRFRLTLPATVEDWLPTTERFALDPSIADRGGGEMILVVDDESTIRTIVQHTLEANGYRTTFAADGVEAIAAIESSEFDIDLVFTDMMMPVMDGAAIAAYLFENHPRLPLIAASGLIANEEVARAANFGVKKFLAKPFSNAELLAAVRSALGPRGVVDGSRSG